jgi:tRNA1(Val) A37 N6-methylase TrmN6
MTLSTTRHKNIFRYQETLLKELGCLPLSLRYRTLLSIFYLFSQIQTFSQADLIITKTNHSEKTRTLLVFMIKYFYLNVFRSFHRVF